MRFNKSHMETAQFQCSLFNIKAWNAMLYLQWRPKKNCNTNIVIESILQHKNHYIFLVLR